LRCSGFRGRLAVGHVRQDASRTLPASLSAGPVTKLAIMSVLNQVREAKSGRIHRSSHSSGQTGLAEEPIGLVSGGDRRRSPDQAGLTRLRRVSGWPARMRPRAIARMIVSAIVSTSPMTSPRASGPSLITGSPLRAVTPVMSRPTSRPYSNSLPPYRWRRVSSMTTPDARPLPELDCRAPQQGSCSQVGVDPGSHRTGEAPVRSAPTRDTPMRVASLRSALTRSTRLRFTPARVYRCMMERYSATARWSAIEWEGPYDEG